MNEIGELRGVKEKTDRQQATSIYTKSKCPNRHELAAKFIEDLLNILNLQSSHLGCNLTE